MVGLGGRRFAALAAVIILLGGCDLLGISEDYELPYLRTAESSYTLVEKEHLKETTIALTYRNGTGDEVYLSRCREQVTPPALEKRIDGEWEVVYSPVSKACFSGTVEIDEGDTYEYDFEIRSWTRPNTYPRLEVKQIQGTYRVNWGGLRASLNEDGYPTDSVPIKNRVSNTFTLTE